MQIEWSAEFARIAALPRRHLELELNSSVDLSPYLLTEAGVKAGVSLRPIQNVALLEAYASGGLFASITVGGGKTLITYTLPTIFEAVRPLLLIPATKFWKAPAKRMRIESYTQLSLVQSSDLLDRYEPDLIICDEAHKLRNKRSAAAKRVGRYIKQHRKTVKFCALTGTFLRTSLKDFAHLLDWCLVNGAPLPRNYLDLEEWSNALDEKAAMFGRMQPGILLTLRQNDDPQIRDSLLAARHYFQRRLCETRGVISLDQQSCDTKITINLLKAPDDPLLDETFERFRTLWETPDGWPLSDPLSVYRHALELACGFFYYWDPRPPRAWLEARREWCAFVRDQINRSSARLDTELAVKQANPDHAITRAWFAIRPTFVPNSRPRWLTNSVLSFAAEWIRTQPSSLVWVQHTACGEALAKLTGLHYYGEGGVNLNGNSIEVAPRGRTAIVSIMSNSEGRNLQGWNSNLVVSPPQSASAWQQMIGRTHRQLQTRDVNLDVVVSCAENADALEVALRGAKFVQQTKRETQKLLLAEIKGLPSLGIGKRWHKNV